MKKTPKKPARQVRVGAHEAWKTVTIEAFLQMYRTVDLRTAEHLVKADRLLCYGSVSEDFDAEKQGDLSTLLSATPEEAVRALVAIEMDPERAPTVVEWLFEIAFASQEPDA